MKPIFTLILSFLLLLAISSSAQDEGSSAPDFSLNQLSGGEFKLSDHQGKVVFIFWLGYACPYCKSAAPSVESEIINAFSSNGDFVAIGIDTWDGTSANVEAFKSQTGLDINYLLMGGNIANTYETTYDRLAVVDKNGLLTFKGKSGAAADINKAKAAISTSLNDVSTSLNILPENIRQFDNYPNPFSTQTTVRLKLEKPGTVQLNVFDISGKKVRELTNKEYLAGDHEIAFQKGNLDSGIYFLQLKNSGKYSTHKMMIR